MSFHIYGVRKMISNQNTILEFSQAHIVQEIESIVQDIQHCKRPNFSFTINKVAHVFSLSLLYQIILDSLPRFLSAYSPLYEYTEHQDAFWNACKVTGLLEVNYDYGIDQYSMGELSLDRVADLVVVIAAYVTHPQFTRCASDRRYQTQKKQDNLVAYAESLHAQHSRLLVVRVDLSYPLDNMHQIGIDDVYSHLDELLYLKDIDPIFNHSVGYAWVLEQGGKSRGYHIHAAFYFLGSKRQDDPYIAGEIGYLWMNQITNGLGCFFNCNRKEYKEDYARKGKLGVGMIHRDIALELNNAIDVIRYLARPEKTDQYLRMKPRGRRSFATGQTPKQSSPAQSYAVVAPVFI